MKRVYSKNCLLLIATLLFASCAENDDLISGVTVSNDEAITELCLDVSTGGYVGNTRAGTVKNAFDSREEFENSIQSQCGFLFDTDNTFICEIKNFYWDRGELVGTVSSATLAQYDNIKVVVCANWDRGFPSPAEGSTISDLTSGSGSVCRFPSGYENNFDFDPEEGNEPAWIPFFGVYEYDNIHNTAEEDDNATYMHLNGTINLLRGVAKVVVTFDDNIASTINECVIRNFNAEGYCAPISVYHQDDYINGYADRIHEYYTSDTWITDSYSMTREDDNTWIAYLTEQNQMYVDENHVFNNCCYIRYSYKDTPTEYHNIEFAKYTDGTTSAFGSGESLQFPERYNIQRNYCYYFNVRKRPAWNEEVEVNVTVVPWNLYENYVEY